MDFQRLGERFGITGRLTAWHEICAGNINRTYEVSFAAPDGGCDKYTFQRINTYVFKNPEDVMHNILNVTEHIKKKLLEEYGSYERRVLSFLTADDGRPYLYTNDRDFWRVYRFVDNAKAYDIIEKPVHFYEAGRAFGEFQGWLSDFPVDILVETIPHFHNTIRRMEDFRRAVQEDRAGRCGEAEAEIAFILGREAEAGTVVEWLAAGKIPYRVTHNDTKINNILFDAVTDKALCVIDLDTVMPGTSVYDFGDAVRSGASTAREDEEDLFEGSFRPRDVRTVHQGLPGGDERASHTRGDPPSPFGRQNHYVGARVPFPGRLSGWGRIFQNHPPRSQSGASPQPDSIGPGDGGSLLRDGEYRPPIRRGRDPLSRGDRAGFVISVIYHRAVPRVGTSRDCF